MSKRSHDKNDSLYLFVKNELKRRYIDTESSQLESNSITNTLRSHLVHLYDNFIDAANYRRKIYS